MKPQICHPYGTRSKTKAASTSVQSDMSDIHFDQRGHSGLGQWVGQFFGSVKEAAVRQLNSADRWSPDNILSNYLTGDHQSVWASEHQKAFDALKLALTTAPVLGYPDFDREFILETDASLRGLGAVLSQVDDLGKTHIIAYASQTIRPSERSMHNYSSAKLELLALKWVVTEKFRDYLLGSKFTVYTNNNPLAYIQTSKLGASQHGLKVTQFKPQHLPPK